jgi:hypothetical protein
MKGVAESVGSCVEEAMLALAACSKVLMLPANRLGTGQIKINKF